MMESYAAEAVHRASEFGVNLDYSESSLEALEQVLARLCKQLPRPASSDNSANDPAQRELDAAARVWGSYFGETIRRLWDGEWGIETYPGSLAPVVSVDIGGAKLFPVMKVYRRLTQGDGENVWKFYQMMREKVSKGSNRQ
jgi:hypothetical protein